MTRYKIDARAELVTLEQRILSSRKSLRGTANSTTATIELAKLPSLERKAAALREEIETLPDRPPLGFVGRQGSFKITERTTWITAEEAEKLELPAFLRRAAG